MFVLDTHVVSELRKVKAGKADRHVAAWAASVPADALFVSVIYAPDPRSDRDALIAATAMVHRMTVVTRNVADFAPTGAPVLDPWQPAKRPRGAAGRPGQPIARAARRPVGRT